ncbi:MAG: hypothetical protein AB7I41_17185 [Candidatus Sericytochromatia bacterium]
MNADKIQPCLYAWRIVTPQTKRPFPVYERVSEEEIRSYLRHVSFQKWKTHVLSEAVCNQFSARKAELLRGKKLQNNPLVASESVGASLKELHDLTLRVSNKNLEGVRKDALASLQQCLDNRRFRLELFSDGMG